jgi:hypothetical protein
MEHIMLAATRYLLALLIVGALITPAFASPPFKAPPAPRYEAVPAARPGQAWAPGYWNWEETRYAWTPGHWVEARPGYVWSPERWERKGNSWQLVSGNWSRDVHWDHNRDWEEHPDWNPRDKNVRDWNRGEEDSGHGQGPKHQDNGRHRGWRH